MNAMDGHFFTFSLKAKMVEPAGTLSANNPAEKWPATK
jgi:hypothetical protein